MNVSVYVMSKYKMMCNQCGYETQRDSDDPIYKGDCPWHQRVLSDGTFAYDEFNQDGEAF